MEITIPQPFEAEREARAAAPQLAGTPRRGWPILPARMPQRLHRGPTCERRMPLLPPRRCPVIGLAAEARAWTAAWRYRARRRRNRYRELSREVLVLVAKAEALSAALTGGDTVAAAVGEHSCLR